MPPANAGVVQRSPKALARIKSIQFVHVINFKRRSWIFKAVYAFLLEFPTLLYCQSDISIAGGDAKS